MTGWLVAINLVSMLAAWAVGAYQGYRVGVGKSDAV
jgi:hypothetical protein